MSSEVVYSRKMAPAGLTLASLRIPQSMEYATLAHLEPQYGLYTSIVPPLICNDGDFKRLGVFQTACGVFRLGFLVEFLSHAAIIGFMAGAAIIIGLQQLKGLFGIKHFQQN
ncbi:hypothetical protein L3X38_033550 [Prunus dulcis]|uniref:SLC26A/SulP transporter domain-containing protein n=1 Tax=Prunus dulcis TaxID=3755 RepID=A0AAD4VHU3_PRUDU|nr:hypothetical protein L3X38_033550 [Prunus dulcis]